MTKKHGFTLIELLIAITIFSIIAVSVYSVFSTGVRLWYRTSPLIQANQSFRYFFATISSDLRNSIAYNNTGEAKIVNFEGDKYSISFMTLVNYAGQGTTTHQAELAKVTYSFERAGKVVKRKVATAAEGLDEEHARSADILEGIESGDFGFEFCYRLGASPTDYDYEWRNAWEDEDRDKGKIPRGVKVTAGDYSKIIFIPTGYLGGEK